MDRSKHTPQIPPRSSKNSTQRRRSMPLVDTAPVASSDVVAPASPEVISSLISSLSIISGDANRLFEGDAGLQATRSMPTSPNVQVATFPNLGSGSYIREIKSNNANLLHPDAAILPTAKASPPASVGFPHVTSTPAPIEDTPKSPRSPTSSLRGLSSKLRRSSSKNLRSETDDGFERGHKKRDSTSSQISSISASRKTVRDSKSTRSLKATKSLNSQFSGEKIDEVFSPQPDLPAGLGLQGLETPQPSISPDYSEAITPSMDISSPFAGFDSSNVASSSKNTPVLGENSPRMIPARGSSIFKTGEGATKRHSKRSSTYSEKKDKSAGSTPVLSSHPSPAIKHKHRTSRPIADEIRAGILKELDAKEARANQGIVDDKDRDSKKSYPYTLLTTDSPLKLQSPLSSPTLNPPTSTKVASPSFSAKQAQPLPSPPPEKPSVEDLVQKQISQITPDSDSAPSPAIPQRTYRSSGSDFLPNEKSSKIGKRSSIKKSFDYPFRDTVPKRASSRLSHTEPLSPESPKRHKKSLSGNNLSRIESTAHAQTTIDERPGSSDSIDDAVDAFLCSPRLSQKIRHPQTGRTISFSEVGDPNGFAVFCCVGMGLTRYITAFYDELALTLKLRLITPDRPGVGDSEPLADGLGTPLAWPDDVYAICQALKITKFSIMAHSAGAIYALATALRMPQHIRGRIHLLAAWIPPSQMSSMGSNPNGPPPSSSMPTSQKILRALPTPILRAANTSFMSATSSSLTTSLPKSPRRKKAGTSRGDTPAPTGKDALNIPSNKRESLMVPGQNFDRNNTEANGDSQAQDPNSSQAVLAAAATMMAEKERQTTYDARLTQAIWTLATRNANPAVDLLVCLERRQPIGFRYVDINRSCVMHHGAKDTRVPVENVKWLGRAMRRCEVRILPGEGHGLMASAVVMGGVLMEIAKEWEDWTRVTESGSSTTLRKTVSVGAE